MQLRIVLTKPGLAWLMAVTLIFSVAAMPVLAQDVADPFGDAPAAAPVEAAAPDAASAVDPATAAAFDQAAAALATDPDVQTLLETNPTTPSQLLRGVNVLVDLRKGPAGRPLMSRLAAANLDDEQLAALVEQYGAAVFLRLARLPELQPMGAAFSARALDASRRLASDPGRLQAATESLADPDRAKRRAAMRTLRAGGTTAAQQLLAILADPTRAELHPAVRTALVGVGETAMPIVMGAMESQDPALVSQLVEVLGRFLASEPAVKLAPADPVPLLLALAVDPASDDSVRQAARSSLELIEVSIPAPSQVAEHLARRATQHFQSSQSTSDAASDLPVTVWHWDPANSGLLQETISRRQAELDVAASLAEYANRLEPGDKQIRRIYLETRLAAAGRRAGLDRELPPEATVVASDLGVDALVDLLAHVPADGDVTAAIAAARLLGDHATADILEPDGARPAPLVRALRHSDPRLRYAALDAVLKLAPARRFMGDSFVPEALARFVGTSGQPTALVVDSRGDVGRSIAAMLGELGYSATSTVDGRDLFKLAAEATDCELILISATLYNNRAPDLLDQLRKDGRTARLPVSVYATSEAMPRAERLVRGDARAMAIVRPGDASSLQFQIAELLARSHEELPDQRERDQVAAGALGWLDRLSAEPQRVFDLTNTEPALHRALDNPALATKATEVLSRFLTPSSQRNLVNLASRSGAPIELRQAAAAAFCASVGRNGTRLTSAEILLQYDEYHAHGDHDAQAREVLGSILDCIERRVAAVDSATPLGGSEALAE